MALHQHQVNVIEILFATETVRQIVLWIDARAKFSTQRTLKSKVAVYRFRDRTVLTKTNDRELHW